MKQLIALFKAILLILVTTLAVLPQILILIIPFWNRKPAWLIPSLWHRIVCLVLNIHIKRTGTDIASTQQNAAVMYAANHASYLDISTLGTWLKGMFVAKSEIASWPIFGFLSKLQNTVFIERKPSAIRQQKKQLESLLNNGKRLMIFPEGSTNDGSALLPFKSSLFSACLSPDIKQTVFIQPITIKYTHIDGKRIKTQKQRDLVTWYGDMDLIPHLWELLKHNDIHVEIHLHDAFKVQPSLSRKDITVQCEDIINKKYIYIA